MEDFPSISGMQILCFREDLPKVKNLRKVREALEGIALAYDDAVSEEPRPQFGVPSPG